MCAKCAGTVIFESRGDGTEWRYVINDQGVKVGTMIGTTHERMEARGFTYSAQTGRYEPPREQDN